MSIYELMILGLIICGAAAFVLYETYREVHK